MKRSIAIINTEIQLINSIEALHHFKCDENYLVIGQFNIRPERILKIEKILEEPLFRQHFKKILHLPVYLSDKNPLRFIGYILAYIKFFFFILFSRKFDYCIFGTATDIIVKPIVFLTQYKNPLCKLCVIDEGIRIIADANKRQEDSEIINLQYNTPKSLLRGYIQAITKQWQYPSLTFFSIFQLPLLPQDNLIYNSHDFFKTNKIPGITLDNNAIVIVGQPLYELNFTTLETYQEIIFLIIKNYSCNPIYYAPHPIETEYKNWMPKQISLLQTHYPLELVLINNDVDYLIGFSSTVLFNCASMKLCKNIISVSLEEKDDKTNEKNQDLNKELLRLGVKIVTPNFFDDEKKH